MNIRLGNLEILDFKGMGRFNFDFEGKDYSIHADNAVGKTTIYDAFLWCLFGKDSQGKTDFDVVPMTDGVPDRKLTPSVTVQLLTDGDSTLYQRKLTPKWVNKRGDAEKTFEGYTTNFYINEVPVKANEFKASIDSIINEQTFRIVTNVDTFLNMDKKVQREYLLSMVDGIDLATLCGEDHLMLRVVATMKDKGYSTDDLLKIVKDRIKAYEKERDAIPARIEEATRNVAVVDTTALKAQIDALEKEIESALPGKYESLTTTIDMLQKAHEETRVHLLNMKADYSAVSGTTHCPKCHQEIADKEAYVKEQTSELLKLGKTLRATYDGIEAQINKAKEELAYCKSPAFIAEQRKGLYELQSQLVSAGQNVGIQSRVDELKDRNKELATLITQQEGIKAGVERLVRAKAQAAQDQVNGLFPTLKFRLFDENINGNIVDDCTAMINGNVPYKSCSRSESIRAGMEVINAIQREKGTKAVVFIDNAESATWFTEMDCQLIRLYVSEQDKRFRFEGENI